MKKPILFFVLSAAAMALFALTQFLIFYRAELETQLFFNQKILYYHVPCAFMLFVGTITCGIYSYLFVKKREGRYDDIALASGEVAVLFGAIMLITGSIWGKVAWETWWSWDARLTTALLLEMSMIGYVLVRRYGGPGSERLAAGLAIFSTINIPLVYFSVRIWRTLHPPTSTVPNLTGNMRLSLWLSVLLFAVVFTLLLWVRVGAARADRRLGEARESALDAGLIG